MPTCTARRHGERRGGDAAGRADPGVEPRVPALLVDLPDDLVLHERQENVVESARQPAHKEAEEGGAPAQVKGQPESAPGGMPSEYAAQMSRNMNSWGEKTSSSSRVHSI